MIAKGAIRGSLLLFTLLGYSHALAAPRSPDVTTALGTLQHMDQRVADVSYRLVTSNVEKCPNQEPQTGLFLHDASQYSKRFRVQASQLFNLGNGPSVLAVARGSPAELAGIRPDDRLIAVNGRPFSVITPDRRFGNYDNMAVNLAALAEAERSAVISIEAERSGKRFRVAVSPVAGCSAVFQLIPGDRMNSGTDGRQISISSALADFTQDDDELAVVLGHELAHNILQHRQILNVAGLGGIAPHLGLGSAVVRQTELDSDRLGIHLAANAGYSPKAALTFWERHRAKSGPAVFSDPSHPLDRDRIAALREELGRMQQ